MHCDLMEVCYSRLPSAAVGEDDERTTSSATDLTESGSEPAAEEVPRPSEDDSLEERLASLDVTSRPQEDTEL